MIPIPAIFETMPPRMWNSSWGPTPTHWYSADQSEFYLDYISGKNHDTANSAWSNINYSTQKNGLSVAANSIASLSNMESTAPGTNLGVNTTRFVVIRPSVFLGSPYVMSENNIVSTSYATSGLVHYTSSIYIGQTGFLYGQAIYTNDNFSTWQSTAVRGTYSSSEWAVIVHKTDSNPPMSVSCTINGRSMGSTSSIPTSAQAFIGGNGVMFKILNNTANTLIAEILVYNSILSAGDTSSVETYLKNKWAISY